MLALWLMAALLVKHFVFDFPFQSKFMLDGKGHYLHDGGLFHAAFHSLGTAFVFCAFDMSEVAGVLAIIDGLIHYHVDFLKSKINEWAELDPSKNHFWHLMGLDQLVHQLTYVLLVALALS